MDAIVYKIDEYGNRIDNSPNWQGALENYQGVLWLRVCEQMGNRVYLEKGDRVHYSHNDLQDSNWDYKIIMENMGIYQVEPFQISTRVNN